MRLRQLFEAPRKVAVAAFGRMNPPTIGHEKLVNKIKSYEGDHFVFLSQTQKPKTDPLPFDVKLEFAKKFFPDINVGHTTVRTPIQMLQMLEKLGYTDIIYVAGSDRVDGFKKLFNDYNGKEYNFNSIEVVSAGERDPDADGAEGMSASKMREAAKQGNFEAFAQGTPKPQLAQKMYDAVRTGMGIKAVEPAEGVAEGVFGLSAKEKGAIMNLVSKLSDIPNMWDHKEQTFTNLGKESLEKALNYNPKHVKYALNLTSKDYEESLKPGWILKQDPKLAAKVKSKTDLAKKRQQSYGDPNKGKSVNNKDDSAVREANYGKYWCSTDKKWKYRKGPKQSRSS